MSFNFSSEYFFQNPEEEPAPWQASVYDDGETFFDRSTARLRYRKMFCWGTHKGGQNWCDYLISSLPRGLFRGSGRTGPRIEGTTNVKFSWMVDYRWLPFLEKSMAEETVTVIWPLDIGRNPLARTSHQNIEK